jgi:Flp pilus assembly protein TadD
MRITTLATLALLAGLAVATPTLAVDYSISKEAPDLASARAKIKAADYTAAIAELTPMLQTHQHADLYNLLAFSYRKSGDLRQAETFYAKALDFDASHKGALEYQGELFVMTRRLDKARENLARLEKLCPQGCEEREELAKAIAAAK